MVQTIRRGIGLNIRGATAEGAHVTKRGTQATAAFTPFGKPITNRNISRGGLPQKIIRAPGK